MRRDNSSMRPPQTLIGLRDRAILAVGFYAGLREHEIVGLRGESFRRDQGHDTFRERVAASGVLRFIRKTIPPLSMRWIRNYCDFSTTTSLLGQNRKSSAFLLIIIGIPRELIFGFGRSVFPPMSGSYPRSRFGWQRRSRRRPEGTTKSTLHSSSGILKFKIRRSFVVSTTGR